MKKTLFAALLLTTLQSFAQEVLTPITSNPQLYHRAVQSHMIRPQTNTKAQVVVQDGTILIETDTLSLPFVDDFSTNTLKPFHYNEKYIYDSIYNAYGPCTSYMQVNTITGRFMLNQSWDYSFNVALQRVDSTPKAPILLNFFPNTIGGDCFDHSGGTLTVYPEYYHYIFDSSNGSVRSQTLVTDDNINPDTILTYAPIISKSKMPASAKWIDNYAYHNYTYPVLPPTIGVATLDGLNQYGRPYNNSSPNNYGIADKLTSKPLDLSDTSTAVRNSYYLSFYYEPRGLGDVPNSRDSLCLEFYNKYFARWDRVWSIPGFTNTPAQDTFKQVLINIPDSSIVYTGNSRDFYYLYKGFQFRFVNYASLSGNNDHWHIDYVRVGVNRNNTDTAINDIAFSYRFPPSLLKNYETMPAWQYTGAADLIDTIKLVVNNLNPLQASTNPPSTNYNISAVQNYPATGNLFSTNGLFNAVPSTTIAFTPQASFTPPATSTDSIDLFMQASLSVSNVFLKNDTVTTHQVLTNTLAYDDGTAEKAYGLQDLGLKKFGYEFNLNKPDVLVGFQVLFTNIDVNVSDLVFTYNLWDSIVLNTPTFVDSAIYTSDNHVPYYIDSVSGFTTYRINPIPLTKNKYYFGWSQTDTRNLQIGYDMNSVKGKPHMYVFTSGTWKKSTLSLKGSPMIRLLLKYSNQIASGVSDVAHSELNLYPNPTNGKIHILVPDENTNYKVEIYNSIGQLVVEQPLVSDEVDIHQIEAGMYIIRLLDKNTGLTYQRKIIKSAE